MIRTEGPYGNTGLPDLVTERWLLEAFCSKNSQLGRTGPSFGHHVLRLSKDVDLMTCRGQDLAFSVITKALYPFLWGALPCTPWCHWQRLNLTRGNSKTVEKIMRAREESLRALEVFLRLCRAVEEVHGAIAFEWPTGIEGWQLPEVLGMIAKYNLKLVSFHGCMYQLLTPAGQLMKKGWTVATNCPELFEALALAKCTGGHGHTTIQGGSDRIVRVLPARYGTCR